MKTTSRRALPRAAALCAASLLCATGAVAQQGATLSVQQSGSPVTAVGSAWHKVAGGTPLTIECQDGKAVVSYGTARVASLPCTEGGALVIEPGGLSGDNQLPLAVSSDGWSTLYSPFQLTVPEGSDVEVYAPTFEDGKLQLTSATLLAPGTAVPPETGLVLKNAGDIAFPFTGSAAGETESALSGSSLVVPTLQASGQTVYTLGHAKDDASLFGFFKYTGSRLSAGKAFLLASDAQSAALSFVPFFVGGETTGLPGIETPAAPAAPRDGKYIEGGRVVIVKGGRVYTASGVRIR